MKCYKFLFLLFFIQSFAIAMEVEQKSLASIFCTDKQWWYVEQEIKSKLEFGEAYLSKRGTKIIFYCADEYMYRWNKEDGKNLERVFADECCSSDENDWTDSFEEILRGTCENNGSIYSTKADERLWLNTLPCFGPGETARSKKLTIAWSRHQDSDGYKGYVWDREAKKEIAQFLHKDAISSVNLNSNSTEIITLSYDNVVHLWDVETKQELLNFVYDVPIVSALFSKTGNEIVVTSKDGLIQILARHTTPTFSQRLLKKMLNLWLLIEKPSKDINSFTDLLKNIAVFFGFQAQELHKILTSFPERMQNAMWLSMDKKIQKYGK